MARLSASWFTATILTLSLSTAPVALAQQQQQQPEATWSQEDMGRIVKQVRSKLASLTSYSVFDWITLGSTERPSCSTAMPPGPSSRRMPVMP